MQDNRDIYNGLEGESEEESEDDDSFVDAGEDEQ